MYMQKIFRIIKTPSNLEIRFCSNILKREKRAKNWKLEIHRFNLRDHDFSKTTLLHSSSSLEFDMKVSFET